ncbi:MAG: hypothetical protein BWX92_03601 [Deltaproteobacteria bacterium ADurb.Bin135]|nr:MAG: hypothetical protein BWX92_03601 [Deltaproteobacteria bacterium ADurb.Bin135]
MSKILLSMLFVLLIIYIIPIVVYGIASSVAGLKTPEGSPTAFLISILISKIGTAIAFVLIFYFARETFAGNWLLYAMIWWIMFLMGEVGQAVGPNYSWKEAVAGMISETAYLPLSAYIISLLIKA